MNSNLAFAGRHSMDSPESAVVQRQAEIQLMTLDEWVAHCREIR